jgi:hypothetical protein
MTQHAPRSGLAALLTTLALTAVAAFSTVSHAQSATNGRSLYTAIIVTGEMSCANAQCHGNDPSINQSRIKNGANNPAAITAAINGGVTTMEFLRGKLTTAQLSDLATYIANPRAVNTAPIASLSGTTLGFGLVATGSTSAALTITLTNTGAATLQLSAITVSSSEFTHSGGTCTPTTALAVSANCTIDTTFTPAATGVRSATLAITHNATVGTSTVSLAGTGVAPVVTATTTPMIEYYFAALDYYFITSRANDIALLDTLAAWQRTGRSFKVYVGAQPGSSAINRYYFDQVAVKNSRGSHFYTLVQTEKDLLASLNPSNSQAPRLPYNEGVDSFAFAPVVEGVGGSCASGLIPVFRVFRGQTRFPDNPNHRFTTDSAIYNAFVALGWDGEGVKFCVPN